MGFQRHGAVVMGTGDFGAVPFVSRVIVQGGECLQWVPTLDHPSAKACVSVPAHTCGYPHPCLFRSQKPVQPSENQQNI